MLLNKRNEKPRLKLNPGLALLAFEQLGPGPCLNTFSFGTGVIHYLKRSLDCLPYPNLPASCLGIQGVNTKSLFPVPGPGITAGHQV